jgi:Protein of unknown function DUF262.
MSNSIYKGKTLSFYELINEQKIKIPIIQRDYAQGREDKKEIRINFLNALYECIFNNNPIRLDFIYGSSINNSFQPLDGQQRLTTLFLLYWYAAAKQGELPSSIKQLLAKFSYETRITSRDFCLALVNNTVLIPNADVVLSERIKDSNWFFLSWKKDPTIDSMLRAIDDIHKIFNSIDNLWEKLTSQSDIITFYYVELENIGLTDDLYIKMNARGKLLTSFENFKASFQKQIKDNNWEQNKKDFTEHFAFKIDTCWTDLFWNNFKKNNGIDDAFMRFISAIAMYRHAIEKSIQKAEERTLLINSLHETPNSVKPAHFSKSSFDYLVECFEIYDYVVKEKLNLNLKFPLWRHNPNSNFLSSIVYDINASSNIQANSASYTHKVLFFAQTEYLRRVKPYNEVSFSDWMRVIRNIVARGDVDKDGSRPDIIRSPQTFDGVINLINELADGCSDIYSHLSSLGSLKSLFAKEQVEEEKNKAKLIIATPSIKQLIFDTEDNELLRGRIDFVFYCMDYDYNIANFNVNSLIKIQKVFSTYFNNDSDISNDLRRAFLTIEVNGNYEFYSYWWSLWNVISATKRRLFDKYRELEYYMYCEHKIYFKKLILQLIETELKSIATDFVPPVNMPNWKIRLIKEVGLLDKQSRSNYIAIPDDNSCCYLLKSKRPRDIEGCIKIE